MGQNKISGPGLASGLPTLPECGLAPLHILQCSPWIQIFSHSKVCGPIYPFQKAAYNEKLKLPSFIPENTSSNSSFYFSINALTIVSLVSSITYINSFINIKYLLSFYCRWCATDRKNLKVCLQGGDRCSRLNAETPVIRGALSHGLEMWKQWPGVERLALHIDCNWISRYLGGNWRGFCLINSILSTKQDLRFFLESHGG